MKQNTEKRDGLRGLFQRDFTLMVVGQVISLFGNGILRFALSMAVLDMTGSPAQFAAISALSMVPTVLLSPFGGLLADRVSRKGIMAALDFFTSGLLLVFFLAFQVYSEVLLIGGVMMALAVIQSFYSPAVNSSIPLLAEEEHLAAANGVVTQVSALANLFGPVLGGLLYGLFGLGMILPVSIVCFFLSAVMECFLHIPYEKRPAEGGVLRTMKADFGAALQFLTGERKGLLQVLLVVAGLNLFFSPMMSVGLPCLVKLRLGLPDLLYGVAEAALSVGMILGGMLSGAASKRVKTSQMHRFLLLVGIMTLPMGLAVVSGAAPHFSFGVLLVSVAVLMGSCTIFNVTAQTLLQKMTPPELLGKVMAVTMTAAMCAMPLGQALYGLLFDWAGKIACLVVWFAGLMCVLLALPMKRFLKTLEE